MALKVIFHRVGSLLALILLGFFLSEAIPGTPGQRVWESGGLASGMAFSDAYEAMQRERFGTDLPSFYFSVAPRALPNLYPRVADKTERHALRLRMLRSKNPLHCMAEYLLIKEALSSCAPGRTESDTYCLSLLRALVYAKGTLEAHYAELRLTPRVVQDKMQELSTDPSLSALPSSFAWWMPVLHLHPQNRLHLYLFGNGKDRKGLLRGDLGLSASDGIPVRLKLSERFPLSIILGLSGWVLALAYGFLIGTWKAGKNASRWTEGIHLFLLVLPTFLLGTFLLLLFANPSVLNLFPSTGISPPGGFSPGSSLWFRLSYWVLPILTFSAGTAAFFALTIHETLTQYRALPHLQTAISKGLKPKSIFNRHILRNALPGLAVTATHILPTIVAGAVIVEAVFTIPGVGKLSLDALLEKDIPIVVALILISGVASILAYWLSDLLQYCLDPRVRNPAAK